MVLLCWRAWNALIKGHVTSQVIEQEERMSKALLQENNSGSAHRVGSRRRSVMR